jgi:predicted TIM-barrel fold metal-dependent hydrolase
MAGPSLFRQDVERDPLYCTIALQSIQYRLSSRRCRQEEPSSREAAVFTRRTLIGSTVAAIAATVASARPALSQGGGKRIIVDAQMHLWKAESEDWKWIPGMKPQLPEPFTIERALAMIDEGGIDRAVIVPPSWPGDRNDYGLEAARRFPGRFGVMGRIPLQNPQSATLLPKWREQPGMLGVRLSFTDATLAWLTDGTADWFWPAAEKAEVPVMFLAPGQVAMFSRIAERHPHLTLIIDHMGLNSSSRTNRSTDIPLAIDQTVALAKYPNVSVKLSGALGNSVESYPFRDTTVYVQRIFDAYGPERCHWGTDMTNSFNRASPRQRVTHFTEELPFLSESDKDWIMGRAILSRLKWA